MKDWTYKMTRPMGRVWTHPRGYLEGTVITRYGIVSAYSQGGKDEVPSTSLEFVHDGKLHHRAIPQRFTARGLITKAERFAIEVVRNARQA